MRALAAALLQTQNRLLNRTCSKFGFLGDVLSFLVSLPIVDMNIARKVLFCFFIFRNFQFCGGHATFLGFIEAIEALVYNEYLIAQKSQSVLSKLGFKGGRQ